MPAKFTYKTGDKPLPGYTIKRGIGHGGFGEVYFAVSDAGKEVALKLLHSDADREADSAKRCLNLKHPHLVSLYDIVTDADRASWIIMEFVAGKTLADLIREHPKGLPRDKVRTWFEQMARAVAYLHDHNIVHRDLKPGNILMENEVVKVGDYGLCKIISQSQQFQHTQGVGTVYYMAPEVARGDYGKAIDIYAAGVILYEMLTGKVPFQGETSAEILVKHQSSQPDLQPVPQEFRPIVQKALQKQPEQRFGSMSEMADAVARLGRPRNDEDGNPPTEPEDLKRTRKQVPPLVLPVRTDWRRYAAEGSWSLGLASVLAFLWMIPWIAVENALHEAREITQYGMALFLITLASWLVMILSWLLQHFEWPSLQKRILLALGGAGLGAVAAWLNGHSLSGDMPEPGATGVFSSLLADLGQSCPLPTAACGYMAYFGLAFFALPWWKWVSRSRNPRWNLWRVLASGLVGVLLAVFWPGSTSDGLQSWGVGLVVLIATAVIVQAASPWEPPPPPKPRRSLRLQYASAVGRS